MYMLDTNIYNELFDGNMEVFNFIEGKQFFATAAQYAELNRSDEPRKSQLLEMIKGVKPLNRSLYSAPWGLGPWGQTPFGVEGPHYTKFYAELGKLKKRDRGNSNDALIAEVCSIENLIMITCDEKLSNVLNQFKPGLAIFFESSKRKKESSLAF